LEGGFSDGVNIGVVGVGGGLDLDDFLDILVVVVPISGNLPGDGFVILASDV